ncbi:putative uncharacterized protein FLJ92257, partial [Papio anubis]|uniref:putative uncharacterized protein FLJ92257 n=1 Tax=Papio anubis TaxID=9555 RepID=UPI0012AD80C5
MTHNGLFRPIPYLTAVSADEATASQQPPLAQVHHYNGLFRPSSCLPVFSPGPELSQVDLTRPSSCLSSQLLPLCRRPNRTQVQATKSRPKMSTSRPLKAPLLPFIGLSRPSCCPQVTSTGCDFTSGCAGRPRSCLAGPPQLPDFL